MQRDSIIKGEPWPTAWLALSLLTAMAIIASLILFYIYFLPVRFVTVVPKSTEGGIEHAPMICDLDRAVCPDWLGRTLKMEI